MNEAVAVARIQAKAARDARRDQLVHDVVAGIMANPILPGAVAMGLNYAAYKSGVYDNMPERSALGGPVWFKIGPTQSPALDTFERNEAFIMSVTMAMALSPIAKAGLQFAGTAVKDLGPAAMAIV